MEIIRKTEQQIIRKLKISHDGQSRDLLFGEKYLQKLESKSLFEGYMKCVKVKIITKGSGYLVLKFLRFINVRLF